jgi:hypothetical protein
MKLVKSIKSSYYWVRALQTGAREDYIKAYNLLEKCSFRNYEFWILHTFLLFAQARYKEAGESCKQASKLLERAKISFYDKAYLSAYLEVFKAIAKGIDLDVSDVKLDKVSKHHLRNFPLRSHPDWKNI